MDQKHPVIYYVRRYHKAFSLGLFVLLITNALDAIYPLYIKQGIDQVTRLGSMHDLTWTALKLLGIMSLLAITRYFWRSIFGQYHTQVAEDVRNRLFQHLLKMGPQFYQKYTVGELMSLIINDVQAFRQGIGQGLLILFDGISILFLVIPLMLFLNWKWTLWCLILFPLVPLLIYKVNRLIHARFKKQQDQLSEISGFIQELIGGIKVVKSFAKEDLKLKQFNLKSKELENISNQVSLVDALFIPVMQFGVASGTVVLLFVAADDIVLGIATIGSLVAFQRFISKLTWPMTALGLGLSQYQKGMAAYERIKEVLQSQSEITDHGSLVLDEIQSIEFSDLSFRYPGASEYVLKNLSFKIAKGESLAIVGPIASGKSTLIQLLARMYEVDDNKILINQQCYKKYTLDSLRKKIVIIPQEPFLFSDTVAENINFGADSSLDFDSKIIELENICDQVAILKEIQELPHSFQTVLGEKGVNLSGGQKQRLTIARAIRLPSELLVFDDNLSAVDYNTESTIQKNLFRTDPQQKKTQIIISHRWSSVVNADKILVLNQGVQEAFGALESILIHSPTLQNMIQTQTHTENSAVGASHV